MPDAIDTLFKLIMLSSSVYPYVELDNDEQNVMSRQLLIKQETE